MPIKIFVCFLLADWASPRCQVFTKHSVSIVRIPGFGGSDEALAAEKVLDCFDQGDAEGMKTCTSQALFTYLDNEVSQKAIQC